MVTLPTCLIFQLLTYWRQLVRPGCKSRASVGILRLLLLAVSLYEVVEGPNMQAQWGVGDTFSLF